MLFAFNQDCVQLRALAHGLAIEFASRHATCITKFAIGEMLQDEFLEIVTQMVRWQNPAELERLVRRRLSALEDRQLDRLPLRLHPQVRANIDDLVVKGRSRGQIILQSTIPPLIFSMLPECASTSHRLNGHEAFDTAASWSDGAQLFPDRSSIQFMETVGLILGRPWRAIDYLFRDGRLKKAIMRGWTHSLTLDDGRQRRFRNISEFIHWLR